MAFMTLHGSASRTLPSTAPQATVARPVVVSTAVAHSPTRSMANPALLYMRNPAFVGWQLGRPLPRSNFSLPTLIAPDATPKADTLFEDPADATKKHFLAKYAIATIGSGGAQSYNVSFVANTDGFVLTVGLADVTDPSLVSSALRIDPTTTRYLLTANLQGLAANWDFTATPSDGSNLTLSLTVTDPAARDSIYRAMTDPSAQAQLIVRRSFPVAAPTAAAEGTAQTLYRESVTAIDAPIPFTFDPVLDKNIFSLLGSVGSGESTWNVTQVPYAHDNRSYPYYQDARQPSQVYYLPDTFQISRQQDAPHAPNITIAATGGDAGTMRFTLSFLAIPIWNPDRIANAAAWWQNELRASVLPGMHLFEASNTALQLTLPASDGSGPALVAQSSAIVDIAGGISCSIALSLAQLQQVYAALFDEVSQLFSGVVTVTIGSDTESIHFSLRAGDFAGSVLAANSTFDAEQSEFDVVISNVVESPVHVDSLPAAIMKGPVDPVSGKPTVKVQDLGQTLTPTPPVDLVPASATTGTNGVTLKIRMLPQNPGDLGNLLGEAVGLATHGGDAGQSAAGDCTVVIDFGHTSVKADPSALWDAIMSNQVVGPVQRTVKVMAFASMFAADPAGATPPPKAVQVVFDSGQTVDFDSSTQADASGLMTQTVALAVPIKAYVVGTGDTSYYRYHVDLVSATGTTQGQWTSSNADSFYVQTSG